MFCQKSYKVSKSKIEIKNQDGKTLPASSSQKTENKTGQML